MSGALFTTGALFAPLRAGPQGCGIERRKTSVLQRSFIGAIRPRRPFKTNSASRNIHRTNDCRAFSHGAQQNRWSAAGCV